MTSTLSMWLGNSFHISLHHIQISPCLTFPSTSIISFTFNLLSTCLRKRNVLIFSKINLTTMSPPTTSNFRICSILCFLYLLAPKRWIFHLCFSTGSFLCAKHASSFFSLYTKQNLKCPFSALLYPQPVTFLTLFNTKSWKNRLH